MSDLVAALLGPEAGVLCGALDIRCGRMHTCVVFSVAFESIWRQIFIFFFVSWLIVAYE